MSYRRFRKRGVSTEKRGNARMRENGYKLIQLWLCESEYDLIAKAASELRMSIPKFLRRSAWVGAGNTLETLPRNWSR